MTTKHLWRWLRWNRVTVAVFGPDWMSPDWYYKDHIWLRFNGVECSILALRMACDMACGEGAAEEGESSCKT